MKRTAGVVLAGVTLLWGCSTEPTTTKNAAGDHGVQVAASQAGLGTSVNRDLAALRAATARYHNIRTAEDAIAAGLVQLTPCMTTLSPTGAMGFHYANVSLIDGSVQADQPELLIYEPEKNGKLRLVGFEFIIPYAFHPREAEPPVLFGQQLQRNDFFQLWGIHAWVWKNNPSGMFASWNPDVSCQYTTDILVM